MSMNVLAKPRGNANQQEPQLNEGHVILHLPDPSIRKALSNSLTASLVGEYAAPLQPAALSPLKGIWTWFGHYGAGRFELRPRFRSRVWTQREIHNMLNVLSAIANNPQTAPKTIFIELNLRVSPDVRMNFTWNNETKGFVTEFH